MASVITPEPVLMASRAAISLPVALLGMSTAAGETFSTSAARISACGRDEVRRGIRVVDDVDLVRAVLGQRHLGLLGAGADVHGGGLAEAAGDRQQLGGRLAQAPVGVVDENEYFSHGFSVLPVSRRSGSEELLAGEELRQLGAAVALVGDDLALLARRALGEGDDRGPRGVEARRARGRCRGRPAPTARPASSSRP